MVNDVTDFHCSASSVSVESYLENGRKLLAAGQLADALTQYHAAVGQLQINYVLVQHAVYYACRAYDAASMTSACLSVTLVDCVDIVQ